MLFALIERYYTNNQLELLIHSQTNVLLLLLDWVGFNIELWGLRSFAFALEFDAGVLAIIDVLHYGISILAAEFLTCWSGVEFLSFSFTNLLIKSCCYLKEGFAVFSLVDWFSTDII